MRLESEIERRVCKTLRKEYGYICLKIVDQPGYPDRLILDNTGKHIFIEFKSRSGELSALQELRLQELSEYGHICLVVRDTSPVVIRSIVEAMATARVPEKGSGVSTFEARRGVVPGPWDGQDLHSVEMPYRT